MAGTITVRTDVEIVNDNFSDSYTLSESIAQTNVGGGNPGIVSLTTSQQDISFGALATPGMVTIQNLDGTNKIQGGPKSGGVAVDIFDIPPLGHVKFYMKSGVTLRLYSSAGTVKAFIRGNEA